MSDRIDLDAPVLPHVLRHDGPRGWFLVTQPEILREVEVATPPSWLIRAQDPLDLDGLVTLARPVSMHITQLTGAETEILAGNIANAPGRSGYRDLPLCPD